MVSADRILNAAVERKVDIVGLSGLITPSLDEMVFVAREMERRGMTLPLLIGGATTSRQHTAVKIAPELQPRDRARARRLAGRRRGLEPAERRPEPGVHRRQPGRPGQAARAVRHAQRAAHGVLREGAGQPPAAGLRAKRRRRPSPGARQVDVDLAELVPYIDWTFFFAAWELKGRFPAILDDPTHGAAARELYAHAQQLLKRIVDGKLIRARGVYGFWPACATATTSCSTNRTGVGRRESGAGVGRRDRQPDAANRRELCRFPMLRQQEVIADGKPNRSLADFVAPCGDAGAQDYVGAFAVTAGLGADVLVKKFEAEHDDYNAILVKALADRLAEAFAEYLHARARADWGLRRGAESPTT